METARPLASFSWDRMIAAVDAVRERALRASEALRAAGIPHVVVGGHAVAAWVARVDEAAVRNTADVDILLRHEDIEPAIPALEAVGFVHRTVAGTHVFLDGPSGSVRSAVHIVIANQKVRPDYLLPAPDISESEAGPDFDVPRLEALVRMKLTSFWLKDQVHLQDLLEMDLIDSSWCSRFPPELAERPRAVIAASNAEA